MKFLSVSQLRSFVKRNLTEGRLEDVQNKFPQLDVDQLARQDPSGPKLKYLSWMAKQLSNNDKAKMEDLVPSVQYFHKNLSRFPSKDINVYKTLKDLENAVKSVSEKKSSKEKRQEDKAGSETIYEDKEVALVYVGTKESCQLYGKGTKWCITMRDASYFEQYTGANVVFYFLLKKQPLGDPLDKVAFAVKRDKENKILENELELYDAEDNQIDDRLAFAEFPDLEFFIGEIVVDASHKPKGLLAKIKDGESSTEEEQQALELYKNDDQITKMIADSTKNESTLLSLAKHKNEEIRMWVAGNSNTPPSVLKILVKDDDFSVRQAIAYSSDNPEILAMLVNDSDNFIRYNLATNNNASPETLAILATDNDPGVRRRVAQNSSVSQETLKTLIS